MDITSEKNKLRKTAQILGVKNQQTRHEKLIDLLIKSQQAKANNENKEARKLNSN